MLKRWWIGAILVALGTVAAVNGQQTQLGAFAACGLIIGIATTIFCGTLRMNGHRAAAQVQPPEEAQK